MPSGESRIEKECTNQFLSRALKFTRFAKHHFPTPVSRQELNASSWNSLCVFTVVDSNRLNQFEALQLCFWFAAHALFDEKTLVLATLTVACLPSSTWWSSEISPIESSHSCNKQLWAVLFATAHHLYTGGLVGPGRRMRGLRFHRKCRVGRL